MSVFLQIITFTNNIFIELNVLISETEKKKQPDKFKPVKKTETLRSCRQVVKNTFPFNV